MRITISDNKVDYREATEKMKMNKVVHIIQDQQQHHQETQKRKKD